MIKGARNRQRCLRLTEAFKMGKGGVAPNHRRDYASDAREQRSIEGRRRSNMKEGRKKKEGENPGKREERKEKRDPIQATRTLALSC